YMAWLDEQDEQAAAEYWQQYLSGSEQTTELPYGQRQADGDGYVLKKVTRELEPEATQALHGLAQQHQVTLNTLMQTMWG
ncbi:condensation domain-containing protein, partial [Paraburkholderia sp. SIMBA_061]